MSGPVPSALRDLPPSAFVKYHEVATTQVPSSDSLRTLAVGGGLAELVELSKLKFAYGRLQTDRTAWYAVPLPAGFNAPPSVVATGQHRVGWFDPIDVTPTQIDVGAYRDAVGTNLKNLVTSRVNIPVLGSVLGDLVYWIGFGVGWIFADLLNAAYTLIAIQTEDAAGQAAQALHQASNLPVMLQTPASLRNISNSSFEIMGVPGGDFTWVAVGPRG